MDEATICPDPSHLLSRLEDILDSDPKLGIASSLFSRAKFCRDEVGFIHPMQFTAFAALTEEANSSSSSSFGTKPQPEDGSSDFFWHHGHKLGICTFVLVPLYRAARDAFMDAYNRYVISCDSRAKTGDELDGNALFLDIMEKEVMKHSKTLLLLSCDFGTAWNSRKVIVLKKQLLPMFMDELLLSALILSFSPKSERAWSHRRWVIKMIAAKCANLQEILGRESELVKTLAEKSKMNYRAWNHRCWMVSYMSTSQVLLELKGSRDWAELHVADNSCFHYRAALWLHRRFLSLVWLKQHLLSNDDNQRNIYSNSRCTSCDISVFIKDELMLFDSCINFPDEEDYFGDYRAQAIHAATYIMWLAKQMPICFGAELRGSSKYKGCLRRLLDDAGKSCLSESLYGQQAHSTASVLPLLNGDGVSRWHRLGRLSCATGRRRWIPPSRIYPIIRKSSLVYHHHAREVAGDKDLAKLRISTLDSLRQQIVEEPQTEKKTLIGQHIHGWAPGCLSQKFKEFKLLEGKVYEITNFELVEDKRAFKITKSRHKFIFYKETNMREIVDDEYLRLMFEFKQFSELTDTETIDPSTSFDMIGRIVLFQNVHTRNSNGGQKRCIDIVLEDVEAATKLAYYGKDMRICFYLPTKCHLLLNCVCS
ncbi:protein farnesyltransferase alpha subunit [Striga asiatica]|uniref:Protein farnesyltransferase alpha subunit n=1 Tax=Striga asiatica TaxID=4170 RepID=A0A5A7PKB2_STRAF|nr:protein farnesyltransferase alpha subunit [Striga asiatica]